MVNENDPKRPKIFTLDGFLKKKFPRRQNIVEPFLPESGLAMLTGPSGIGKTHVALGIGLAVAGGGAFLNWTAPNPRNVLLLDSEMAPGQLQQWMREAMTVAGVSKLPRSFDIMSDGCQKERLPSLLDPVAQRTFYAPAVAKADLIIVDNLISLCGAGGESWPDTLQTWILGLRRQKKSVLILAHAGKSKSAYRGSSRQIVNLDTVLSLRFPTDYKPRDGARFVVEYPKHRGFWGEDAEPFEAQFIENKWLISTVDTPEARYKSKILTALTDRPHTTGELYSILGNSVSQVLLKKMLAELEGSCGIESYNVPSGPKGGRPSVVWFRPSTN